MSDRPSPSSSDERDDAERFLLLVRRGMWLTGQGVVTFAVAIAAARFDAMHDYRMGLLYLTVTWTCWWIMVAAGWAFLGLALVRTMNGLMALDRMTAAYVFTAVGITAFSLVTFFIIQMARTFANAVWL